MKLSKSTLIVGLIVIVVAGLFLAYSLMHRTPFPEQKPAVGEMAPEISLGDLSSKMIRLSELKGKVVLLNFWASWCPPCKAELADFQKVYETYGDKGLEVVAIAINEVPASLVIDMRISFPVAIINERVSGKYGEVSNVPVSYLIGKDGRIIKKLNEVYPRDLLIQDVEKALSEAGPHAGR